MTKWTETDQALFNTIARMKQPALVRSMTKYIRKYYPQDKVISTPEYILVEGDIPVLLVAHMDTVFKSPPEKIYYDYKQHVMWSPQGLGADDRAGVYLIWKIIQAGYRPHICLTTDEEKGGLGAMALIKAYPNPPFKTKIKYAIELDRQGMNDCVFYSCANEQFSTFIEKYDFITNWGTYSDISDICPAWGIAGVNLSVGYIGEHHETETLNTKAMMSTYKKVCQMLQDAPKDTVTEFNFIPDPYENYYLNLTRQYSKAYAWDFPYDEDDRWACTQHTHRYDPALAIAALKRQCVKCHKIYDSDDVFPVKAKDYKGIKYYCLDCVGTGINWCKTCGEPFEVENDTDDFCPDCAGKERPVATIM